MDFRRGGTTVRIMKALWACCLSLCLVSAAAGEDAAEAYNRFGFELLGQCRKTLAATNFFLSPAGVVFALSMVQNGAGGETLRQIQAMLHTEEIPVAEVNEANKVLLSHLSNLDPKIKLEIANSIWTDQRAEIRPGFIAANRRWYNAEAASADFQDPTTVKKINEWVSDHTHGKIPEMVRAPLDPMLRLILLDAIYFKGDWLAPFETNLTRELPFRLASGATVAHPRMKHSGKFEYYEGEDVQAVELPYAGRDISMYVFLPKGRLDGLPAVLRAETFDQWIGRMQSRQGTVELPRFKLENEYDLKNVLGSLGMRAAFTKEADLSGISDEALCIDWVKQKTYLEVNEQGTVAAAVTGVGVRAMAMRAPEAPFEMVVDRPFLLAIREKQTGLILFVGAIFDPR